MAGTLARRKPSRKRHSGTIQSEIGNPISEIAVARSLSRLLSAESALWLGSSMPIRDMDMFAAADGAAVPVAANRGASGIDGTLAAATGFAAGLDRPVTLLCGDLTFLHDLQLADVAAPLVAAADHHRDQQSGRGIFHFLPIADNDAVFGRISARRIPTHSAILLLFDLDYHAPVTMTGFEEAYRSAETTRRHTLIEVRTERTINVSQHRALAARIQETLFGRN